MSHEKDGFACVREACEEPHPTHPGQGHCGSCLSESNDGFGIGDWTFRDDEPGGDDELRCCCRDSKIMAYWDQRRLEQLAEDLFDEDVAST